MLIRQNLNKVPRCIQVAEPQIVYDFLLCQNLLVACVHVYLLKYQIHDVYKKSGCKADQNKQNKVSKLTLSSSYSIIDKHICVDKNTRREVIIAIKKIIYILGAN